MTQKQRVLTMLRDSGSEGVRSDEFIRDFMPRAAARIQELKDEGHKISSEREGKYVRYRLQKQRGVTSRSTSEHAGYEGTPDALRGPGRTGANEWIRRAAQPEEPGDESEVLAAASEVPPTLFELDPPSAYDPFSEAA